LLDWFGKDTKLSEVIKCAYKEFQKCLTMLDEHSNSIFFKRSKAHKGKTMLTMYLAIDYFLCLK